MVAISKTIEYLAEQSEGGEIHSVRERRRILLSPRFLTIVCLLVLVASACLLGTLNWPWDVDEVETLQELSLLEGANSQTARMQRMIPIWYWCQSQVMKHLPINERTVRLLPVVCGILLVNLYLVWAARSQGLPVAICLALLILASPLFLELAQMNRFYTMALLFQFLAQVTILSPTQRFRIFSILLSIVLTLAAILCHNVLLIYFVLAGAASSVSYVFGWFNRTQLIRSLAAGTAGVCLYLFYLRPIVQGWNNFLPHRTTLQVVLSFISEVGMPMLALSFLGAALCLRVEKRLFFGYWTVMGAASSAFILVAPTFIWFFNYRYAVLFMLPIWILAAHGIYGIGLKLVDRRLCWVWYCCVAMLLLPKVLSYYQDGSRKDLRSAARIVSQFADEKFPVVYCNLPSILHYYLPMASVKEWRDQEVLEQNCFLVLATNGWDNPVHVQGHIVELLASIGRRRFDEQTYLVRVYRLVPRTTVSPSSHPPPGPKKS